MSTTTLTRPAAFPQPRQILRQGFIVAALLVIGVGLGMALDTGRAGSVEAAGLTQAQQAAANRLQAQADVIGAADLTTAQQAAANRLQAQADATAASAIIAEHGPFTSMAYRDPSVVQKRFGGLDANLDPNIVLEHGEFTAMTYRDPAVVRSLFAGTDANLDPDVAPTVAELFGSSSSDGEWVYDTASSRPVQVQSSDDEWVYDTGSHRPVRIK